MKKLIVLIVLVFGLMSFNGNSIEIESQIQTCCTVTALQNGVPVESATACINGIGPETTSLACSIAKGEVKKLLGIQ